MYVVGSNDPIPLAPFWEKLLEELDGEDGLSLWEGGGAGNRAPQN